MPLLYVILKYAKGDVEEASRELYEGMNGSAFADCSLHAFTDLWFTICSERVEHIWIWSKNKAKTKQNKNMKKNV